MLVPHPVERTKIPTVYPLQMGTYKMSSFILRLTLFLTLHVAKANLERMTRHWPLIFSETVAYSMVQVKFFPYY